MTYIPEQLKEIKAKLDKKVKPSPVTVRELLSWFWGSQRRGWYVVQSIGQALGELEIETFPDFSSAYIDSPVEFRLTPWEAVDFEPPEHLIESFENIIIAADDPTYRISRLAAANTELVSIKPDGTLEEAITLMITNDFSQIPVMQSKRDCKGVISWRSIGQRLAVGKKMETARELMEPIFQVITSDTSLFKAIPTIVEHDYVLVRNSSNEYCGIVTASDLSLQFKQLTEPFLLVGEIEKHLRQILLNLSLPDIQSCKDPNDTTREINSVADLTFGEYCVGFSRHTLWTQLGLSVHQQTFCKMLEQIRSIRNDIMHFDPDGLEAKNIEVLRSFVRLLQTIKSL